VIAQYILARKCHLAVMIMILWQRLLRESVNEDQTSIMLTYLYNLLHDTLPFLQFYLALFNLHTSYHLSRIARVPILAFEWLNRFSLVKPYKSVKLLRQHRLRVVAPAFCVRTIDDANKALKTRLSKSVQQCRKSVPLTEIEEERWESGVMHDSLVIAPPVSICI
jgi:hypothetical protein